MGWVGTVGVPAAGSAGIASDGCRAAAEAQAAGDDGASVRPAHGIETSGWIEGGMLGVGHRHAEFSTAYLGVPPSRMRCVLDRWETTPDVLPIEAYAFVDVGCGKGRAVLLASERPFREALGVELDGRLAGAAIENAERWRSAGRSRCPITVVYGDATEVELPDGPLVVYLYNPFLAPVLRALLERLQRRRAVVDVLYLYPKEEGVFAEFPRFELLWREGMRIAGEDVGADELSELEDPCSAYRLRVVLPDGPTARDAVTS